MLASIKKSLTIVWLGLCLAIFIGCNSSTNSRTQIATTQTSTTNLSSAPRLAIPIGCTLGQDCFIMHYVDRDESKQAVDFDCGRQTYDGHTGVDFAISDWQVMTKGIPVQAAAPGKVLRVRDGVADRLVSQPSDKEAVNNTECGNGLVIDHGGGWETQYCHLRRGSLIVKPGMQVQKGTVVGMVGASGLASFPHVHLTVRYRNQIIDPFVGVNASAGCTVKRQPLWESTIDYVPTGLIRAGFATKPPSQTELWQGKFSSHQFSQKSEALIFWVQAYGVQQGDLERFKLIAPNSQTVIEKENLLKQPYRSWVSYVGKRNSRPPLLTGQWRGQYQLLRGKRLVINVEQELQVQ